MKDHWDDLAKNDFTVVSDADLGFGPPVRRHIVATYFGERVLEGDHPAVHQDRDRARDVLRYRWHGDELTLTEHDLIAQQLRQAGHDAVTVLEIEVGLAAKTDEDVLAWASRSRRCVVTENISDFARLAQQGFGHHGIVFVLGRRFPRTGAGLQRMAEALDELLTAGELPGPDGVTWLR